MCDLRHADTREHGAEVDSAADTVQDNKTGSGTKLGHSVMYRLMRVQGLQHWSLVHIQIYASCPGEIFCPLHWSVSLTNGNVHQNLRFDFDMCFSEVRIQYAQQKVPYVASTARLIYGQRNRRAEIVAILTET